MRRLPSSWKPRPGVTALATAAIGALVTIGLLSGCSSEAASAPLPAGCSAMTSSDGSDGDLVILVDGSLSGVGISESTQADLTRILTSAATDGLRLSVGTYGGSDAEITFSPCLDGVHFRPDFNQPRRRTEAIPQLVNDALSDIGSLPSRLATTDPTSALRAGAEKLTGSDSDRRTLVILTDGVSTAGCAQLPDVTDPSDTALAPDLVARCQAMGALPDLRETHVVFVGVGRSAASLSAESVAFLRQLTMGLCEATNATCTVAIDLPPNL